MRRSSVLTSRPRAGGADGLVDALIAAGIRVSPELALRILAFWPSVAAEPDEILAEAIAALIGGRFDDEGRHVRRVVHTWARGVRTISPCRRWARAAGLGILGVTAVVVWVSAHIAMDPDLDGFRSGAAPATTDVPFVADLLALPEDLRARIMSPNQQPGGWLTPPWRLPGGDCAPFDSARSPGMPESCGNRSDDDCDGLVDVDSVTGRPDRDGDGLGGLGGCDPELVRGTPAIPAAGWDLCDGLLEVGSVVVSAGSDLDNDGCLGPDALPLATCSLERQDGAGGLRVANGPRDEDDNDPAVCAAPACPETLMPADAYLVLSAGRTRAGWLLLFGCPAAAALGWVVQRWRARRRVGRELADATREAESSQEALAELPGRGELVLAISPTSRLRRDLASETLVAAHRIDVARTVLETARHGGFLVVVNEPRTAPIDLELWVDTGPEFAPWSPRAEQVIADLTKAGARVKLRTFDGVGQLSAGRSFPELPLLVIGSVSTRNEPRALLAELRAHRVAVWLHPPAPAALLPRHVPRDILVPLDDRGVREAVARLRGLRPRPRPRTAVVPRLTDADRARLIWLAAEAPFADPVGAAALLRELVPSTPESILLVARLWLGGGDLEDEAERATERLRQARDPLLTDRGRVSETVRAALMRAEPPLGTLDHVIWRREVAQHQLRSGELEAGLKALEGLRLDGYAGALGLYASRRTHLLPMPAPAATRLDALVRAEQSARGAPVAPTVPTLPSLRVPIVAGLTGGAIGVGVLQWAWSTPIDSPQVEDVTLTFGSDGTVFASNLPKQLASLELLTNGGRRIKQAALVGGEQHFSLGGDESGVTCAQIVALGSDETVHRSAVVPRERPDRSEWIPRLTVKTPTAGDAYRQGGSMVITWTSSDSIGRVTVDIYEGGTGANNKVVSVESNGQDDGVISGILLDRGTFRPSDNYFVCIAAYASAADGSQACGGPFSILSGAASEGGHVGRAVDLYVDGVVVASRTVVIDALVELQFYLGNLGDSAPQGTATYSVHVSPDRRITSADTMVSDAIAPNPTTWRAGASKSKVKTSFPARKAGIGNWYVGVVVYNPGGAIDSDTNNNSSADMRPVVIVNEPQPVPRVDEGAVVRADVADAAGVPGVPEGRGPVTIFVVDADSQPVPDALVACRPIDVLHSGATDVDGTFTVDLFTLESPTVWCTIARQGYLPSEVDVVRLGDGARVQLLRAVKYHVSGRVDSCVDEKDRDRRDECEFVIDFGGSQPSSCLYASRARQPPEECTIAVWDGWKPVITGCEDDIDPLSSCDDSAGVEGSPGQPDDDDVVDCEEVSMPPRATAALSVEQRSSAFSYTCIKRSDKRSRLTLVFVPVGASAP